MAHGSPPELQRASSLGPLIHAWLAGRSVARGLPLPVPDRGGFRVDSGLDTEICRWVFPDICDGLKALGREIDGPFRPLKLCADGETLMACLPSRWQLDPPTWFMQGAGVMEPRALPRGYRAETVRDGAVVTVQIWSATGDLAASGYAGDHGDTYVYDRIITAPDHQRQGLARAVMAGLQAAKPVSASTELLVATQAGRPLYESLGWSVISPYSTAAIPATAIRA